MNDAGDRSKPTGLKRMFRAFGARIQGLRAGLMGADLATSATTPLPAADLEAVVSVHVAGPWLLSLSGGPSALLSDGAVLGGWIAQLGAGWQP